MLKRQSVMFIGKDGRHRKIFVVVEDDYSVVYRMTLDPKKKGKPEVIFRSHLANVILQWDGDQMHPPSIIEDFTPPPWLAEEVINYFLGEGSQRISNALLLGRLEHTYQDLLDIVNRFELQRYERCKLILSREPTKVFATYPKAMITVDDVLENTFRELEKLKKIMVSRNKLYNSKRQETT